MASSKKLSGTVRGTSDGAVLLPSARASLGDIAHASVTNTDDTTGEIARGGAPTHPEDRMRVSNDASMASLDPIVPGSQLPSLAEHHHCAIFA
jgi:hypothetical protein